MKKLIRGIVDFRHKVRPDYRETFAKLALGQKPDVLFIACSDSRVVPNLSAT
jgi:carbonic anhydrase